MNRTAISPPGGRGLEAKIDDEADDEVEQHVDPDVELVSELVLEERFDVVGVECEAGDVACGTEVLVDPAQVTLPSCHCPPIRTMRLAQACMAGRSPLRARR